MAHLNATPLLNIAVAAFPPSCRELAECAAKRLVPFIDSSYSGYHTSCVRAVVLGKTVKIPKRLHFIGLDQGKLSTQSNSWPPIQCLCTRSTDGHIRQDSLRGVLGINEPWAIPFVVLLAGEYVVEIVEDMLASLSALNRDAYVNFVRENRPLMRVLRSKATSYWDRYYRDSYPDLSAYPGLALLHQLEAWAS